MVVQPEQVQALSSTLHPCPGTSPSALRRGSIPFPFFKLRTLRLRENLTGRAALKKGPVIDPTNMTAVSVEPGQDGGTEWMPWCLPREQRHPAAFLKPPRQQRRAPQVKALGPGPKTSGAQRATPQKEKALKWAKYWP